MIAAIRRLLSVPSDPAAFQAAPGLEETAAHHRALLEAARERLRDAHRGRDLAATALREAEDRVRRAREVIDEADRANAASAETERLAQAAAQAWVAAGSPRDARPDPELLKRAGDAFNAAIDARVIADGARAALPGLTQAVEKARAQLEAAAGNIRQAVGGVLKAIAEPEFARLEQLARETEQTAARLQGFAKAVWHASSPIANCSIHCSDLLARLRQTMPGGIAQDGRELWYSRPEIDRDEWTELGKRLLEDLEAKL